MLQDTDQRTAQAWTRALERAISEALDVLVEPVSGEAFVESASRPGVLYRVSTTTCSCPAGQQGQACKHRACYLAQIGELAIGADPEPTTARCGRCFGEGACWLGSHDDGWVRGACPWCGGSGRLPIDAEGVPMMPTPAPTPTVVAVTADQPVAA